MDLLWNNSVPNLNGNCVIGSFGWYQTHDSTRCSLDSARIQLKTYWYTPSFLHVLGSIRAYLAFLSHCSRTMFSPIKLPTLTYTWCLRIRAKCTHNVSHKAHLHIILQKIRTSRTIDVFRKFQCSIVFN